MPHSYIFRGTTIDYRGNPAAIVVPYTCTSRHPVKALWFALECVTKNPATAVVYLAETQKLTALETMQNYLEAIEEEEAYRIKPEDFYSLCEGYIHIIDFQKILLNFGFNTYQSVRKDNLTLLCRSTPALNHDEISLIVEEMRKYLKK